jgi:hypothetical protein
MAPSKRLTAKIIKSRVGYAVSVPNKCVNRTAGNGHKFTCMFSGRRR